jgi:hypothetical protein
VLCLWQGLLQPFCTAAGLRKLYLTAVVVLCVCSALRCSCALCLRFLGCWKDKNTGTTVQVRMVLPSAWCQRLLEVGVKCRAMYRRMVHVCDPPRFDRCSSSGGGASVNYHHCFCTLCNVPQRRGICVQIVGVQHMQLTRSAGPSRQCPHECICAFDILLRLRLV